LATVQGAPVLSLRRGKARQVMVDLDPKARYARGLSLFDVFRSDQHHSRGAGRRLRDRRAGLRLVRFDLHCVRARRAARGTAKYLFQPLAMAVVFAMLTSYVLSRTLIPTMVRYLLKPELNLYRGGEGDAVAWGAGPPGGSTTSSIERPSASGSERH
jgi:hypothetical protein